MLLVLFGVCIMGIVASFLGSSFSHNTSISDKLSEAGFAFCCVTAVVFIPVFFCVYDVKNASVMQAKIGIIEQQNTEIEQKVSVAVNDYLKHESATYQSLSSKDAVTAAMIYPSLASNTLVQKQIEVYQDNNNKIMNMKLELASVANSRWWLYFGK